MKEGNMEIGKTETPQKNEDVFEIESMKSIENHPNKAKGILSKYSSEKAMGKEVKFSPEELKVIVRSWEGLDIRVRELTLIACPEVAAALLYVETTGRLKWGE